MALDLTHLSDELPSIEGERHEREPVPGVTAREYDAAVSYASQCSSHGFGLSAIGELIPSHGGEGRCERFAAPMEHQGRISDEA